MRHEDQQVDTDHPEVVRSTPVAVPPPTDRDDADHPDHTDRPDADPDGRADLPEGALDDRGAFADPVVTDREGDLDDTRPFDADDADRDGVDDRAGHHHDGVAGAADLDRDGVADRDEAADRDLAADPDGDGRTEFHEPAPLPTAFGATSVGDAVAASALAGGRPEDERDARGEDTALPGDGAPGRTEPFDDERADPTAADRIHDRDRWTAEGHSPEDDVDGVAPGALRGDDDAPAAGAAGYGSATPAMVDPDAEAPEGGTSAAAAGVGATGVAAGVAAAARPTGAAVPRDAATLFEDDAAQAFRDRWRDVQLHFVDDPRAAVGEAQSLVEEAISALSEALAAQKEKLGGWQGAGEADTEQLRVAVRQYRDFLDRVLGR
ncbi:hypothetical protein ACFY3U_20630 [Micromonospora sp. NPDC000089]|uniref:hypothetical protein n=1 Tax=unclassified Micromonospora TaxID=2617518 RepID=UPI0036C6A969